ncbi:hypothetical protein [Amycolatopsis jiangsuensis]|uniref:Uncharacterized protein n=1 Tax=Amycolatopsis jiangsuensis TaxID=1181879 RepID=A0A840ITM4_9PSEU|nr:hypothetical protein [Amycolatopsis jiangsuensis]MBB4684508.1 hypothetical protein [Amycolatopsis jiangsuensis]
MSSHRVSDWGDVRALHKKQGKDEHASSRAARDADSVHDPSGAGNAELVADETGTIELDPAEIAAADAELAKRQDEIAGYLRQAGQLASPLKDGYSPVAAHLRKAFGLRGSADAGVQAVLQQYLDELTSLRDAIRAASAGHVRHEGDAQDALGALHRRADEGGRA